MERDKMGRFIKGSKGFWSSENSPPRILPDYKRYDRLHYVLGVLFGDGYVTKFKRNYHIGLVTKSLVFAQSFADSLKDLNLGVWLGLLKFSNGRFYYRVNSYSKSLFMFYKSFMLRDIDEQYLCDFIRGFYESDGHDRGRGRGLLFFNTNRQLLSFIRQSLKTLGIGSHYTTTGKTPDGLKDVFRLYVPSRFKAAFIEEINPAIKIDSLKYQRPKPEELV